MPTRSRRKSPCAAGLRTSTFFPRADIWPPGSRIASTLPPVTPAASRWRSAARSWTARARRWRRAEAARGGRGVFSIVPDAAETYRLKIISPAGIGDSPLLPPASSEQKIAIAAGRGVFAPGAPLEFTVRAAKDRLPLVITARLRGMLVGQRMLVTSSPDQQAKANAVSIPLDDQVAGVIRLTVYDYTKSPPKVLAERLVYRQPRRLVVRAAEGKKPGGEISLSIQNEKGRPVAAVLGLTVLQRREGQASPPSRCGPDLLHALLSDGDLENPAALEDVDLNLSDADDAAAATSEMLAARLPGSCLPCWKLVERPSQ